MKRELVLIVMLATGALGCAANAGDGGSGGHAETFACPGENDMTRAGTDPQTVCVEVVNYLGGYGCTFSGPCNAAPCAEGGEVCYASESACLKYADDRFLTSNGQSVQANCDDVIRFCSGALLCAYPTGG